MKAMAEDKPKETAAVKYQRLLDQASKLKEQAETELKEEIEAKINELNAFGFDYRLTEGKAAPLSGKPRGRPKGMKMTDAQKQAMREGRERAKREREAAASSTA